MLFCKCYLLSGVLAYTLRDMVRSGIPRALQFAVFCFYAFLPILYSYAPVIIKDILYSGAFVGYGIVVYHALEDGPACRKRAGWWAAFLLFSVLLLLVRHNGKMVVWPMTVLLIIKAWAGTDARRRTLQKRIAGGACGGRAGVSVACCPTQCDRRGFHAGFTRGCVSADRPHRA